MLAFFGATLRPGAELVIEATNLRSRLRGADLCLTGEGKLDLSSTHGKAPVAVAKLCGEMQVRCCAIVGSMDPKLDLSRIEGLDSCVAINDGSVPIERTMRHTAVFVAAAAEKLAEKL
jgi:glycerate kinase